MTRSVLVLACAVLLALALVAMFLPVRNLVGARLATGLAGKVVGAGGLLVVSWRLGEAELDTGFHPDDKAAYPDWVRAINAEVAR